ncbi:MAG: hypothetical protein HKN68_04000, partial [Saprospiraceae bacterium]|nr:hypothetical protein [Saprospiraceae bacterium]
MGVTRGHTWSCICRTIFFSAFLFIVETADGQCDAQYDALMDIYNATSGENWNNNDNWGSDCDICDWYGISCDVNGNVTGINLYNNGLSGSLPDVFFSLPFLENFDVYNCDLNGPIPATLSSLNNLRHLNLSRNRFTGDIPREFFRLPQIQNLYLRNNLLEGSLPDTITSSTLINLWINNNSISGIIPSAIGNLSSLQTFYFYRNNINGNIPPEIGQSGALRIMSGYNNQLAGNLPSTLEALSNLEELNLSNNNISGGLGLNWSGLSSLKVINLNGNSISDPFPSGITQANNLEELRMNNNNVSGNLPADIGDMGNLEILHLYNNRLSGSIPYGIGGLLSCAELDLSRNQLSGSIPSEIGDLNSIIKLKLNENNLSGIVPSSLCSLPQVRELKLDRNNLSGEIPLCIGDLTTLTVLNMSYNQLFGQPPESLGLLSNLTQISFFDNHLTGCYPDNYSGFCSINPLAFENNCMNLGFQEFCSGSSCSVDSALYILSSMGETVCEGETIELSTISDIDGWMYEWSTGDSGINLDQISIMPTQSAQYAVTVTTTDGCTYSDAIQIQVVDIQVSILSDVEYCFQSSGYQLDASPGGGVWSGDHINESGLLIPIVSLMDYEIFYEYSDVNGCVKTIDTIIRVNPTIETDIIALICDSESYEVGGEIFELEGHYDVTLQTVSGCDSVVHLDLTVNATEETDVVVSICEGDSYEVGGEVFDVAGVYDVVLQTVMGCDSVVHLDLTVNATEETDVVASICEGEGYEVGGEVFELEGYYDVTLQTVMGCDSIVHLDLTINATEETDVIASICEGEVYEVGGEVFDVEGVYDVVLQTIFGCDSIIILHLTVYEHSQVDIWASICDGDMYEVGDETFSEAGAYSINLLSSTGCDSIVNLSLSVQQLLVTDIIETVCSGEIYDVGGEVIEESGEYQFILESSSGCDSIVNLDIMIYPDYDIYTDFQICEGESLLLGGEEFNQPGSYDVTLLTSTGCDSVIVFNLEVNQEYQSSLVEELCPGESVIIENEIYDEEGIYTIDLQSISGCDSTIILDLSFTPQEDEYLEAIICNNDTFNLNGNIFTEEGVYTIPIEDGLCGHDITLDLTVNQSDYSFIDTSICYGGSIEFLNEAITDEGEYFFTLTNSYGCDSIVEIQVYQLPIIEHFTSWAICPGDTFNFGNAILTETGNYEEVFINDNGCDSL